MRVASSRDFIRSDTTVNYSKARQRLASILLRTDDFDRTAVEHLQIWIRYATRRLFRLIERTYTTLC